MWLSNLYCRGNESRVSDCSRGSGWGSISNGCSRYGIAGVRCTTLNNSCSPSPCLNGGTCSQGTQSGYNCSCPHGFTGNICQINVNECSSSPCLNNSTCIDGIGRYDCYCPPGYIYNNSYCQQNASNSCLPNPCSNGATCFAGIHGYSCSCSYGFTGNRCQTNINECNSSPCGSNATCIDRIGRYDCQCPSGYSYINSSC
ncbi:Sushi, von Willebrand factor type A, EGF and pentraxin domain-containing protein 1, partial [Trichoplax sp. H2]